MIYIKVELWPKGDKSNPKTIGEAKIWNTGEGDTFNGFYQYVFFGVKGIKLAQGKLSVFKRTKGHVWDLIAACLMSCRDFKQFFRGNVVEHEPIEFTRGNRWTK